MAAASRSTSPATRPAAGATIRTRASRPGAVSRKRAASELYAATRSGSSSATPRAGAGDARKQGQAECRFERVVVDQPPVRALEDRDHGSGEEQPQQQSDRSLQQAEARDGGGRHGGGPHDLHAPGRDHLGRFELVQARVDRLAFRGATVGRGHAIQASPRRCDRRADRLLRGPAAVVLVLARDGGGDARRLLRPRIPCGDANEVGRRLAGDREAIDQRLRGLAEPELMAYRVDDRDARDEVGVRVDLALRVRRGRCRVGVEHGVHLVGLLEQDLRGRLVLLAAEPRDRNRGQQRQRQHAERRAPPPQHRPRDAAEILLGSRELRLDRQFAPRLDRSIGKVRSRSLTSPQSDQFVT